LQGLLLIAGVGALGGCSRITGRYLPARPADAPPFPVATAPHDSPTARLLNRAAFGPTAAEMAQLERTGARPWFDEQLQAPVDDSGETPGLMLRVRQLDVVNLTAYDLRDEDDGAILRQMQQAAILRAVYTRYPLRERMIDFWTNHFNIYARKGFGASYKAVDDLTVIRKHALTSFPELLRATAHSPAMLAYLDNQINKHGVANENYARELMELHTLGVHGGYTQKDVQEVARCLTGWTIEDRFLHRKGTFRFDPDAHDDGEKVVLGHVIPAGGDVSDGDHVLDLLAKHPSTARFIAQKLVHYFHGPGATEESTITQIAAVYQQTNGSIPAMLEALLLGAGAHGIAPALLCAPPLLKRPFDFMISGLRGLGADTDGGNGVQDHLAKMGQPLFQWPMPDGYPDKTASWTGSLLARWNFAFALTRDGVPGTSIPLAPLKKSGKPAIDTLFAALLPGADTATLASLRTAFQPHESDPTAVAALILAAPAFQWR